MTTAVTFCKVCSKDTVHDVGVVDGIWCILGCHECQGKQAATRRGVTLAAGESVMLRRSGVISAAETDNTGVIAVGALATRVEEPKPKKPHNTEEADLDRAILELAHLYGYLAHHTRPAWSEKGYRTPLMGDKGFPDWVLTRAGSPGRSKRVIFIETKSSAGVVSPEQKLWYDTLNNAGAEVYVVRPAHWDWLVERLK